MVAGSRQKVVRSNPGFPIRRLENSLSVNPAVNGYLFESGKDTAAKGEGSICLSAAVAKIQCACSPYCPYGHGKPLPLHFTTKKRT